jgi:adenylate cyclase class 2
MPIETEAKFRLADPAALRGKLLSAGAEALGCAVEHDTYFDTPDGALGRADCGLRIRVVEAAPGQTSAVLTYKGPRAGGPLKIRLEEQTALADPQAARAILVALGYAPTVSFQKRRESHMLGDARVEIDELPELGFYLEIEAPDEPAVRAACRKLGLADERAVTDTYAALVAAHLSEGGRTSLSF